MSPAVEWRLAEKRDRRPISVFVCTDPEKPLKTAATGWNLYHPRQYEHDAQQIIRSLAKCAHRPPKGTNVLVGIAAGGLVALASWTELDEPGFAHVDVMGVAISARGEGIGKEMLKHVLGRIEQWALDAGAPEMYVEAEVFRDNQASLGLCRSMHFTFVEEAETGAQTWALSLPLLGTQ